MIQIYTKKHGDYIRETHFNERTGAIKTKCFVRVVDVLEIIDSYKYSVCWSMSERSWNENLDRMKEKVLKLKEGEQG